MSTDPITLAREVLDDELGWEVKPGDLMHAEDTEGACRLANAAPTLARAVGRVVALADRIDEAGRRSDALSGIAPGSVASAEDIRTALNGGTP